jgi:hypothetical protein
VAINGYLPFEHAFLWKKPIFIFASTSIINRQFREQRQYKRREVNPPKNPQIRAVLPIQETNYVQIAKNPRSPD